MKGSNTYLENGIQPFLSFDFGRKNYQKHFALTPQSCPPHARLNSTMQWGKVFQSAVFEIIYRQSDLVLDACKSQGGICRVGAVRWRIWCLYTLFNVDLTTLYNDLPTTWGSVQLGQIRWVALILLLHRWMCWKYAGQHSQVKSVS